MPASEARVIANRQNSLKSTGPKSTERSRRNGLKHGLSGSVVVTEEDGDEIERRTNELSAGLDPKSPLGAILVRQLATLSVKMERAARRESEALAVRVRHAAGAFDEARYQEARRIFEGLAADPREGVRLLRKSPEGVDRMIQAWRDLRVALTSRHYPGWEDGEFTRAANLLGLIVDLRGSRLAKLARACSGNFSGLEGESGSELGPAARKAWALERLYEFIDAEVAALAAHRSTLDHETIALDRDGAADLALFDSSKDATLARRYESEARRGFFKALDEFRKAEAEVETLEEVDEPEPAPEAADETAPLASLRERPVATPRASVAAFPGRTEPPADLLRRSEPGPSAPG